MKQYKKITCFENKRRVNLLKQFRKDYTWWWENVDKDWARTIENKKSEKYRESINLVLDEVDAIIIQSWVATKHYYTPPPAFWWVAWSIDFILNIFRIYSMRLWSETITDMVDMSIWNYNRDYNSSIIRTLNPFYWIDRIIWYILSFPLMLISSIFELSYNKIEENIIVKVIRGIISLLLTILTVLASLKTIFPDLNFVEILSKII